MEAIPPNDYDGTIADWIIALCARGYDGEHYYDIDLSDDEYDEILEECEGKQ